MIPCLLDWLLKLATRLLACSLKMPEPLVHTKGAFVFAQVRAVETGIGRTSMPGPAVAPASSVDRGLYSITPSVIAGTPNAGLTLTNPVLVKNSTPPRATRGRCLCTGFGPVQLLLAGLGLAYASERSRRT